IDANHLVPLALGQLLDRSVYLVPDARIGDQDVQPPQALLREIDQLFRVRHLAEVGLTGFDARTMLSSFLLDVRGGLTIAMVAEDDVRAGLREHFDRGGADSARSA